MRRSLQASLITDARADRRTYEAVVQPRSDRSDRATASVHFPRRRGKDALLTVFKSDGEEVRLVPIAPTADFCSAPLMETGCGKCRPAPRGLMESIRRVSAIFGYYLSAGQPTTAGGRTCG